jgi:8-oxo-dGTP diphosphatase
MPDPIDVVGAIIERHGLVLCARRGPGRSMAGRWEFPGGKVEAGETHAAALMREIAEELGCEVRVGAAVQTTTVGPVTLTTYRCRLVGGEPAATEHAELRWLDASELAGLDWAPADVPSVERLIRDAS